MGSAGGGTLPTLGLAEGDLRYRIRPGCPYASGSTPAASSGLTCADKRYYREMASCKEARFYLNTCGVHSLDGNHDGVPCETLCHLVLIVNFREGTR